MIAFSDTQLQLIQYGASYLSAAERDRFLRSLASRLPQSFNDDDLAQAIQHVLCGLGVSARMADEVIE